MASTALKKITNEAKKIRKAKPNTSWKSAVKQAGVKYRAGKIAGVRSPRKKAASKRKAAPRKKAARKKTARKKAAPRKTARKVSGVSIGSSVSSIARAKKKQLEDQLGRAMVAQHNAKKVSDKKKKAKRVREIKQKISTIGKLI